MGISQNMTQLLSYLKATKTRQADFAAIVGVSQATVSKLIGGSVAPSLELAVRIERATGGEVKATSWVPETESFCPATPQKENI